MTLCPLTGLADIEQFDLTVGQPTLQVVHGDLGKAVYVESGDAPRHHPTGQPPDGQVVADAEQIPGDRPQIGRRVEHEDDGRVLVEHRACPGRERRPLPDVESAGDVAAAERLGRAGVEHHRPVLHQLSHRRRFQGRRFAQHAEGGDPGQVLAAHPLPVGGHRRQVVEAQALLDELALR